MLDQPLHRPCDSRPSARPPAPSTQKNPNASPTGENNWRLSDENSKAPASVVTRIDAQPGSPIPYEPGSSGRKSASGDRLKPGVTMAAAQAEISTIAGGLAHQYPKTNAGHGAKVVPIQDDVVGNIKPTLMLLPGAVEFVLIIACANVRQPAAGTLDGTQA